MKSVSARITLLMPAGAVPFQLGPAIRKVPAIVASDAAADVIKIEGVGVDELDGEIALLRDHWHGEHDGFGSQVEAQPGVRSVGVRRLSRGVRRCGDARNIRDVIPWGFEFGILCVREVVVLNAVAVHHREAVDIGFLRDGSGFGRSEIGCRLCARGPCENCKRSGSQRALFLERFRSW